jgi:hypothetical protein
VVGVSDIVAAPFAIQVLGFLLSEFICHDRSMIVPETRIVEFYGKLCCVRYGALACVSLVFYLIAPCREQSGDGISGLVWRIHGRGQSGAACAKRSLMHRWREKSEVKGGNSCGTYLQQYY